MIKGRALIVVVMAALVSACTLSARQPAADGDVLDVLYRANCAGCHGADGKGGAARGLADPVFLQIADEATLRRVTASGVPGTAMPAFAKSAGGALSDTQIDTIVHGVRSRWAKVDGSGDVIPPPYAAAAAGDPKRGQDAFGTFCSRCHGADGRGGQGSQGGGSIVDPSYLSLVSDQGLRTTVIAGRPDLAAPDWRGNVPGRPMSSDEISNVVAWLAAKRLRE
jgi:mono/diheme cytochrome c family protein